MSAPKLIRVHRLDTYRLDETYFTGEGYFVDEPVVTRVGIFEYANPDGTIRRELRLPEHVFDKDSLASYEGKPVIVTHRAGRVDKDNVDDEHIGTILSKGIQAGNDVKCRIIIHDTGKLKRSGLRELSLGYDLVLDETPGTWKGQPYDAIQTEIRVNHLALVGDARAGDRARLNMDSKTQKSKGGNNLMAATKKGKKPMTSDELIKSIAASRARHQRRLDEAEAAAAEELENKDSLPNGEIDTPEVATEPSDSIDFIKNRRDSRAKDGAPETLEEALACVLQQDEDIDALIEMVEALEAKTDFDSAAKDNEDNENDDNEDDEIVDVEGGGGEVTLTIQTDAMDRIVRERMKLGRLGDRLNLDGLEDMKPLEAKKAVIRKVNPTMRLDGKSKAYINAAFDLAVDTLNTRKDTNYQRRQMAGRMDSVTVPTGKTGAQTARDRMIEKMMNGGNE